MKKTLLSSSAIAGAALLAAPVAAPAFAGTAQVGDNAVLTLKGNYRMTILVADQDVRTGRGRGYQFRSDESDINFNFDAVADNGLEYGIELELGVLQNQTGGAEQTWGYLSGNWGTIQLGDTNGVADNFSIGGKTGMPGRGGYDGDAGDIFNFGVLTFGGPGNNFTGDSTKIQYFTPELYGFTLGVGWSPDSGNVGSATINDNNSGNFENNLTSGVAFTQDFNGFGVQLVGTLEWSDAREITEGPTTVGADQGDAWIWTVGGVFTYAGFTLGASWGGGDNIASDDDFDTGWFADVGLKYTTGPWTVGGGYFYSNEENAAGPDSEVSFISVGGNYQVAPGFQLASDINFIDADNTNRSQVATGATNNEGTVFVFSTIFSF